MALVRSSCFAMMDKRGGIEDNQVKSITSIVEM